MSHESYFLNIFKDVAAKGKLVRPRGLLVTEIENYSYEMPPFVRFQNFASRKLNLNYIKDEFTWYLKGDKYDVSIAEKAKIWKDIINKDGSITSNYGQYIFSGMNQFDNVVNTLVADKDSRRACMMILGSDHLASDTKDVPCTYSLGFRIRDDQLNMSVRMRSQDAIYGMCNDLPAFSFIHEMVLNALRRNYPQLKYGMYHHTTDSFHVYEKHFKMIEKITGIDPMTHTLSESHEKDEFKMIKCPPISGPDEVDFLRALNFSNIPDRFEFSKWISSRVT